MSKPTTDPPSQAYLAKKREAMAAASSSPSGATSLPLDGTAGGPPDLDAWALACDAAATAAESWPTALTSATGAAVKTGFVEGPYATGIRSVLWIQDFEASKLDRVVALLGPPFESVIRNAPLWDGTFQSADVVGAPAADVKTVSWRFSACPLWPRDLLYLFHVKEIGGKKAYVYPSVSRREGYGKPTSCCRVRAKNMFPSIDRIERLADGRIRLVHMITTRLGGLICDCCYNSCFESTVLQTYASEADKWRSVIDGDAPLY
ncbi:hypothetical protein EMIHUDRAFT_435837 [Emiliania huxleyi CCMP1516]|uniref:START domain-containing protein n=2 Tax=Emiliania huxleyi TaxID=2903 RepID=A0A0D3JAC3_EMIH1|nr:hypothetical protein EMIHUDRAFT_435837 [Emiliania huxleyi CCMP1516]EOD20458.1 hypothetical protein EMIHUDRAFT_435837 [Emiliania huxleyi CCMP1516]|eukprot:XP_005772887.1 hypothetical protein EMIHUDRAFT_435837 [Emiliania huxleyi CCMP1516]